MLQRPLGRTGLTVSVLSFGCGAVGGLMVRGAPADQERAVARALDAGIVYFDTAAAYGNGESERNLGRVLKALGRPALVGTKIGVPDASHGRIGPAIAKGLAASLQRLGRDSVDLFQLHNPVDVPGDPASLSLAQVLEEAVPALDRLRRAGKTRHIGITAIGDATSLRRIAETGLIDTMQIPFNLLNPSAETPGTQRDGHDFDGLLTHAATAGVGGIGIRVLAGGALSGEAARHPIAQPVVAPIGSGVDYATDLAAARRLQPLVDAGAAESLAELALRFALTPPAMSTVLIGLATLEQLEIALRAAEKGPLPEDVLARIRAL